MFLAMEGFFGMAAAAKDNLVVGVEQECAVSRPVRVFQIGFYNTLVARSQAC